MKLQLNKGININVPNIGYKNANEILITLSKVNSSLNEVDNINYIEFLFKYKIIINNQFYYYPLKVFVDNEYSIIRGHYLGFNKEYSYFNIKKNNIKVLNKQMNLNLVFDVLEEELVVDNSCPFVLCQNRSFGFYNQLGNIVTLDVHDYECTNAYKIKCSGETIEDLIDVLNIEYRDITQLSSYYYEDEFILEGVKNI